MGCCAIIKPEKFNEVYIDNNNKGKIPKEFIIEAGYVSEANLKEYYCCICD